MIDPQIAYRIDARILLGRLVRADQSDLREIRQDFARYLTSREAHRATTWQEAWNRFTGATEHQPGRIRFTPARCKQCHGKRFDMRRVSHNLARTGQPHVCGECRGTGRGTPTMLTALYIAPPVGPDPAEGATAGERP